LKTFPLFDGIREKWIGYGMHQGIVDAIMIALKENTGHYSGSLAERLKAVDDVDTLKNLLRRAVKAKSMEEFEVSVKEIVQQEMQKGIQLGILQGRTVAIMDALKENTGHCPGSLAEKLKTIDDVDILKNLHRRAIKAKSLEDFEAGVKELIPN